MQITFKEIVCDLKGLLSPPSSASCPSLAQKWAGWCWRAGYLDVVKGYHGSHLR